jgi:predicted GNAT family acetyltransferase
MVQYFKVGSEKLVVLESDKPNQKKMALTKEGDKIYFNKTKVIKDKIIKKTINKDFKDKKLEIINKEEYFDSL